jgi:hypothetical protein
MVCPEEPPFLIALVGDIIFSALMTAFLLSNNLLLSFFKDQGDAFDTGVTESKKAHIALQNRRLESYPNFD